MTRRADEGDGPVDSSEVLVTGPWRHRFVAANGARFHVVEALPGADGPLVLLLHGFPQFWWSWRDQLPALAAAGYRAVALDLRGYGGSDKPPRGYDTPTLAADVAGVVRALGAGGAVIAGQDWGGWLAWSMPSLQPRVTRAVAALSAAHPLAARAALGDARQRRAWSDVLAFQLPGRPERRLTHGTDVERLLRAWAGPQTAFPDEESVARYRRAMRIPFVAHSSMEYYRWWWRSLGRRDGRRFARGVAGAVDVPVLHLAGGLDPFLLGTTASASHAWACGPLRFEQLPRAGHFLTEQAAPAVTDLLLDWLAGLEQRDPQ